MKNANETTPKLFVFVLMPFTKDFEDIYKVGIKPACTKAGAYCERVDEQIFEESILERIYNQIAKADVIVSDMTGRNPNVFYETGYAHALGKQVVLLTQDANDIPFDLKHYPHIVYEGRISLLKEQLQRRIKWCVENPKRSLTRVDLDLEFYLLGMKLISGMSAGLPVNPEVRGSTRLRFRLDVHNASNKICDASAIELGLIVPIEFENAIGVSSARLPDNKCLHLLPKIGKLLPDGWKPVPLEINVKNIAVLGTKTYDCILRIFSEIGSRDIPFKIRKTAPKTE